MKNYVLDACAIMAFIHDEQGANSFENILNMANTSEANVFVHKINLLEVYYDVFRYKGKQIADDVLDEIKQNQIEIISNIPDELFSEDGRLKASYKISLADSLAVACASIYYAELVTADHHELDAIESKENIKFFWIR
jgi:predicted nucleic acid-binding protein